MRGVPPTLLRRGAVEFAHRVAVAQDGTKVKTLRGSVFIRGITEIRKNEASAVPSAHFDYISGRARSPTKPVPLPQPVAKSLAEQKFRKSRRKAFEAPKAYLRMSRG